MYYNFTPAADISTLIYGASRPGYPNLSVGDAEVTAWLEFMRQNNIRRVCCLLSAEQLAYYTACRAPLLDLYVEAMGRENVLHTPIADFTLAPPALLTQHILPFFAVANAQNQRVVVHCSAGIGRTGHVLAAYLVAQHGFANADAIAAVAEMGRNALEAGGDLHALLNHIR